VLEVIADIEILIAGVGAIVFAVSYGVFFAWRSTPAGKSLMYFVVSLVALFCLNAAGRWLGPDYWARDYVRVAVYTALLVTMWRLVVVLWRSWRRESRFEIAAKPKRTKENS
jgi:hypothetical protein